MNFKGDFLSQIILIFFLILLNAFFSASEIAIISLNEKKIKLKAEDDDRKALTLLRIIKEPSRFLSTIQVGMTFAGFFLSAVTAVGISNDLGEFLSSKGIPFGENIALIGFTLLLSYVMLVFGELIPKKIALQNSEKFAMMVIKPINIFEKMIEPFVSFLSFSSNSILKIFGFNPKIIDEKVTHEEILSLVQVGKEQGTINPVMSEWIESVLSFDDIVAEEIMTARTNVFMMNIDNPINPDDANTEKLLKHSRIPIYKETIDNIIGILYLKDYLLQVYQLGFENINIEEIMRPAYFVSQRMNINDLFLDLQNTQNQFAVLVNEYGGFPGIVTMEDLVEEIIGDVYDQYDSDQLDIEKVDKNIHYARGSISIKELNSKLDTDINESSKHFDTLGGLLIYLLGYIPLEGDEVEIVYEDYKMKILEIKNRRIRQVKIMKTEE